MQRLLKFSCHKCGAKLAVPLQMSGLSDNCPKCGTLVTSPSVPAEVAPAPVTSSPPPPSVPASESSPKPAADGWSAEQLADALRPKTAKTPPVGIEKAPEPAARVAELPTPTSLSAPTPLPAAVPTPEVSAELPTLEPRKRKPQPVPEAVPPRTEQALLPELPLTPEPQQSPPAVAAPSADVAKEAPDLFQSPSPFPPAPTIQGLGTGTTTEAPGPVNAGPENLPAAVEKAAPSPELTTPAAPASDSDAPASGPRRQDSRSRSKLQSISRRPLETFEEEALPPPTAPPNAFMPETVPDKETAEEAAQPGMGEVLASNPAFGGPLHLPAHDSRPWLHVPLITVGSSPRRERRLRLNRIAMLGVASFLLVDLLVVLWFCRKPISNWLSGPPKNSPVAVSPQAAKPDPRESSSDKVTDSSSTPTAATASEAPMDLPTPADFTRSDSSGNTTPPPPPASVDAGSDAPVPMAIPVTDFPGEPSAVLPAKPMPVPVPPTDLPAIPTAPAVVTAADQPPAAAAPEVIASPPSAAPASLAAMPMPEAGATPMALASNPAPAAAPLPADLPPGADTSSATASGVPYGGLPPPPPDMAHPNGPPPTESSPAITLVTTPVGTPKLSKVPKEALSASDVLQKFLSAATWQDRLPYVQKGDTLRAAMEKNASQFGDGPIRVGQIDFVERYVNKNGVPPYCMFELSGGSLEHPVLTLVEQSTKNGVKVDWEAFVDFKESLLLKFLENQGSGPGKFRVMLRRKHYFDKDVPDVNAKDAFEVKQPNGPFQGHIFVPKNTNLSRQLANQLGWSMDMPVIAELAWRTDGKHHWVELTNISNYGWRG